MKPKAKTLIEKLGFVDPDRATTKHDEIQLWVYNNIVDVLRSFSSGEKTFDITFKKLEHPILQTAPNYKSIVGFVDLYVSGTVSSVNPNDTKSFYASIEIKSVISSCGDLIRQINFYKKYEPYKTVWIVVSPDDRFSSILKEQGIFFYKIG